MPADWMKTEQGISDCYWEGVYKHSGSISGFIHVFTQLVKNSQGDGTLILKDADEALSRLLGELSFAAQGSKRTEGRGEPYQSSGLPHRLKPPRNDDIMLDIENQLYWLSNEMTPRVPPIDEVIAQAAENLADPNFFIAEISGIISALVELKSVATTRRGANENQ